MTFWHQVDGALTRTSARYSTDLRDALINAINIDKIVDEWNATHPAGGETTPQQAREWANVHVLFSDQDVLTALRKIYGAGYLLGEDSAQSAVAFQRLRKAPKTEDIFSKLQIDWSAWKPGGNLGELLVRPKGGLQSLLDKAYATIKGFNATTINRIGTRLADALLTGASAQELAKNLKDIVADPVRAYTIANTEMKRAMSNGAMDNYRELGVEQMEWSALDPCDLCAEFDGERRAIGDEFGDDVTEPPAHTNCRCTLMPVPQFTGDDDESDSIEMSAHIQKGVPGPWEVARAMSRLEVLPNPAHPELDDPLKYVESPWQVVPVPTVDPNLWDDATVEVHDLDELVATDEWLKRKKIAKHIEAMGQAITPFRSLPLIAIVNGQSIIIDGHHRLMAVWLLGQQSSAAYTIRIG
jgi:SPP1 gp7 family putative phage head morphogenesis protein